MTAQPLASALAQCRSPLDLMALAGVAPPSAAIGTVLGAVYAQPCTEADRRAWASLSSSPWPSRKARRVAACIGRRGLKTSGILAWSCAYEALCVDHGAHAAVGSRLHYVVIAPLLAQAREALLAERAVLDQLSALGVRYTMRDAATAPEIVIASPRGRCEHTIAVMTASDVSVRGFAIPFVAFDEAGFLPFDEQHAVRDRDIVRAVSPATVQFPEALSLFVSSPGAPGSLFQSLVEKPAKDTLVVRAPSWVTNPRITETMCRHEAGGDLDVLAQEYEARRVGYAGENFVDTRALVVGSPHAGKGPRGGEFVVGLDAAQTGDETAIVVCSCFEVEVAAGHAPIKHLVAEHLETMQGSRKAPLPVEVIASRAVAISRAFGRAPILSDRFLGPVMAAELVKLGLREFWDPDGDRVPPAGTFCMRSMAPEKQTPRWKALRSLVHGGRLHLPAGAESEKLRGQLAALVATQQSSGALKVEGRRDDLCDALALAVPVALKLQPSADGPAGRVVLDEGRLTWDDEGLSCRGSHDVREHPDGRRVPAETPRWDPYFEIYARDMIAQGVRTPGIIEWEKEQRELAPRGINVPVEGESYAPSRAPAQPWGAWAFGSRK